MFKNNRRYQLYANLLVFYISLNILSKKYQGIPAIHKLVSLLLM